jgi:CubicO group peptidase (beta-lactamase class C family)
MRLSALPSRGLLASLLAFTWARAADDELGPRLEKIAADCKAPGMAALVLRGDTVIASAFTGVRKVGSPEPITLEDRFHLGSNTKSMTATLAGMFVDE